MPQPTRWSLGQLEEMALAHHPAVLETAAAVEAARGNAVQAGLRPNPVISYEGFDIGELGTAGKHGGFVSQEFVTAGKRQLAEEAANREVAELQRQLDTVRQRVLGDVRLSYYAVVFAQRRITISRQLFSIANTVVDIARRRLEAREVSTVDLLQAQTEAQQASLRLIEAEHQYRAVWRRLSVLISGGMLPPTELIDQVPADLPQLNFDDVAALLLRASPELATANAGVERARSELRLAEAGRYPNFGLQGGVVRNFVSDNTQGQVGVSVPLPLYNRNQGAIYEAQGKLTAAEHEVARVGWNLQQRLASAFQDYEIARARAHQYSVEILPRARQTRQLVERGYGQGEFQYDAMLLAQRTVFQIDLDYVSSLEQLWQSVALINSLLLSTSLDQPPVMP